MDVSVRQPWPTGPVPDRAGCAGVVLAAGAGRRYGMPKALAEGGAWLRAAIAALRDAGCAPVFVVLGATGPDPEPLGPLDGARAIWAADWAEGMSAALRAGLAAVAESGADYAVIMPVDTPDVGAAVVARVVAAARMTPSGLARAVFGARPGHPVVFGRGHWDRVRAMVRGDAGARAYLSGRADLALVRCDDLAGGLDHDRPR
jgi:nicotine blue oxidoreductase